MNEADVMLRRTLSLRVGDREHDVVVKVFRPKPAPPTGRDWQCDFSIAGLPDRDDILRCTYGVDEMQAAILTLQHVRLELRLLRADGLDLRWLGMVDLGFPCLAESEPSIEEWRTRRG